MRLIGMLDNEDRARRLANYLLTLGIETSVDPGRDGQWEMWVLDEDRLDEAARELNDFLRDPGAPRYARAQAKSQAIRKEEQRAEKRYRSNLVHASLLFRSGGLGPTPLTIFLLVASIAITLITAFGDNQAIAQWLWIAPYRIEGVYVYYERLAPLRSPEVWRLVTPIFVHLSPIHLFFNMYWLWQFGRMVEGRKGLWVMAALVLLAAAVPNLGQFLWSGPRFGGMSGVLYALFGYLWIKGRFDPADGLGVDRTVAIILMAWLALGFTGIMPIANVAHVGGLVTGGAFGLAGVAFKKWRRRR